MKDYIDSHKENINFVKPKTKLVYYVLRFFKAGLHYQSLRSAYRDFCICKLYLYVLRDL